MTGQTDDGLLRGFQEVVVWVVFDVTNQGDGNLLLGLMEGCLRGDGAGKRTIF